MCRINTNVRRWMRNMLVFILALAILGVFSATTRSQGESDISFGYGAGIQVIDPAGVNAAPIWLPAGELTVDYVLYSLSDRDTVTRYRHTWYEAVTYDVTGLPVAARWQQDYDTDRAQDPFIPARVSLPDDLAQGFYVLEADYQGQRATLMVSVGEVVLTARRGADGTVLIWAAKLQTGAPVAAMSVSVYAADGTVLDAGVTDASGLVRLTIQAGMPALAIGRTDSTAAIVGLTPEWQYRADGWWYADLATADVHRIYLHTDRPIYRPGQIVYYQAVLRDRTSDGYVPTPEESDVEIVFYDARGNTIATQTPALDAYGTVNGQFTLADEPPLGLYQVELVLGDVRTVHSFEVQAYTKPEYQVQVTTPKRPVLAGDVLPITVDADYYFGSPVTAAAVTLKIYRTPRYSGYYDDIWWPGPQWWGSLVREETGVTGPDGQWRYDYTVPADEEGVDWSYHLVATVTDAANRPTEASTDVAVYWSGLDLRVESARYGYAAGTPVDLTIETRDRTGTPRSSVRVTLHLTRSWDERVPSIERTVTSDAQGRATATLTDLPQGWYRVLATGVDDGSRTATVESYLWIYGAEETWWWSSQEQITLALDKEYYAPGDTAILLIQTRVAGIGLLTLQRNTLISEEIVTIDGPVTAVDIPVTEAMTPNVHLTFHMVQPTAPDNLFRREGSLIFGRTELQAPAQHAVLDVRLDLDRSQYLPGDSAQLTVTLTDHAGNPQRGRVAIAVVDEAIFALAEDRAGSIVDAFYAPQPDRTAAYDSLVRNPEYYGPYPVVDEPTTEPPLPTPTAGREEDTVGGQQVRRVFLDTAYWQAMLDTNDDGQLTVTVPLPDSLTTWRVVAKAVTLDTKVGEARTSLLVSQEIVARPMLPRFAVLGDRFAAGLIAQNDSGSDASGAATLTSEGLLLLDEGPRSVAVPDDGSTRASWTAVAKEVGSWAVLSSISTDMGQDAVETLLSIKPFGIPARAVRAGQANPQADVQFDMPLNAVNDASTLTVRLAPSLALGVLDGLDDLIDYPYGCVEQTMSRVLPTAVAAQVYAELGLANPKADELPDIVSEGLQKIYGFQHNDGGWGWFFDDDGAIYTTAYVLFGLTAVEQSGFAVDQDVTRQGFAYLAQHYPQMSHAGMQAFVQYVLAYADRGDLDTARALAQRAAELDAAGLATLALTLAQLDDQAAALPLVDRLLQLVHESAATAHWPAQERRDEYSWRMMTSDDKNTALAVAALARLRPDDARLPKAVRWLMEHRRGAGWSNTQATAFTVLGLLDYIKVSGELSVDYAYRVELNGSSIASGRVTPATAAKPIPPVVIPGTDLVSGINQLTIVREGAPVSAADLLDVTNGNVPLYYTAVLDQQLYFDAFQPVAAEGSGIDVVRRYELIQGTPHAEGVYSVGDVVRVTLDIDLAEELYYVMVQDPIPAGFDVIGQNENPFGWQEFGTSFFWREWGYNRKDVRDDRVDFFITHGWPGRHTLTYTMRAVTPGDFSVPPSLVSPMYAETLWGRSGSDWVRVAPESLAPRPVLAGDFNRNCVVTDFDLQLVAASWPTADPARDVIADGLVDLSDLAAVAQRRGANCTADLPLPSPGDTPLTLLLSGPSDVQTIGAEFEVRIALQDTLAWDGMALQLHYDPTRVRPRRIEWPEGLSLLTLGPVIDNGQGRLLLGGYKLGKRSGEDPGQHADVAPVTIVFTGLRNGTAAISLDDGQIADTAGRIHSGVTDRVAAVEVHGEQSFLPMIQGR